MSGNTIVMTGTWLETCCCCFSLRTGTILIIVFYEWAHFGLGFGLMNEMNYRLEEKYSNLEFLLALSSILKKITQLQLLFYLICFISATIGLLTQDSKFLYPFLTVDVFLIIFDAIVWFFYPILAWNTTSKSYSPDSNIVIAMLCLALAIITQALPVYFWVVVYNYYLQLQIMRRSSYVVKPSVVREPRVGGYPQVAKDYPYGGPPRVGDPYGGPPRVGDPYGGPPRVGDPYVGPPRVGYGYEGRPRVGGYPGGYGNSPYGVNKREDDEPLAGSHPPAEDNSPRDGGSPAKGKNLSKDNESSPGSGKDDIVPDVKR